MGLKEFKSQTVFLDTAPLIYFIEGHTVFQSPLERFFSAFERGDFSILTSTLTIIEVLVKPLQMDRVDLVRQYKEILSSASGIEIMEMTLAVAYRAAELRAKYGLRTPDSIQVGTALEYGARYFLTNDLRLKTVTEINIIRPQEL